MTFDVLTYRIFRLWKVILLGVLPPLATVYAASWLTGASYPVLTALALALPALHVLRYVGQWQETLVVSLILSVEMALRPPLWLHFAAWIPLTLILSFLLLPPIKGALVGLQWALRMHGFDPDNEAGGDA